MAQGALKRGGGLAWTALAAAVAATLAAWAASWGSIRGWWSIEQGLAALPWAFWLAVAATALGLFARFRRRDRQLVAVAAVLIGLGLAGFLAGEKWQWERHPPLHDVTTNLDDPPRFAAIAVRRDLLAGVPRLERPGHERLSPRDQWKAVHADAYRDLRPVAVPLSPAATIAKVEGIARRHGWRVIRADRVAGELEAVATTRFFGFTDDIAVRARPMPGGGSVVDVRSVSRRGISDGGRGARNIERLRDGLAL